MHLRTSTHGRTLAVIATHSYNVHIKNIYTCMYIFVVYKLIFRFTYPDTHKHYQK